MDKSERTRRLLIMHGQTYPDMQIQDLFKFLYQSAFGCEHLLSSEKTVAERIRQEYDLCVCEAVPVPEKLDGTYSRVPLVLLKKGISAATFGKLFALSARHEETGERELREKLGIARDLVNEGLLPFSVHEFEKAVAKWEASGFPAVRHSDVFRETYHPAYRVIADRYVPYLPLFCELDKRLEKGNVILAVEGGSASGKTTLGNLLADVYDCTVFHMDDFFLQPEQRTAERYAEIGGNIDRERFLEEVLQPLQKGETVCYRPFDCSAMQLADAVQVTPKPLTVVEGAYSMHPELEKYYDFSVFLDISPEFQQKRIQKRNSSALAKRFFNEWIPMERAYFEATDAKERCCMAIIQE